MRFDANIAASGTISAPEGIFDALTVSGNPVSTGTGGGGSSLTVRDQLGGVIVNDVDTIKVTDGTLTDEGSGTVSILTGGGSGSDSLLTTSGIIGRKLTTAFDPVALYCFDDNLLDSSGNGFDLSLDFGVELYTSVNGLRGVRFDGDTGYTYSTTGTALEILGDITLEFLVVADGPGNSPDYLLSYADQSEAEAGNGIYVARRASTTGNPYGWFQEFGSGSDQIHDFDGAPLPALHHVAFVRDSNVVTLYIDGVATDSSPSLTGATGGSSSTLNIGSFGGSAANAFYGTLCCVKIIASALTAEQVYSEYRSTWATAPAISATGAGFFGAVIEKSETDGDQVISDGVTADISFPTTVYDTGSWVDPIDNTRLVVPSGLGITHVILTSQIGLSGLDAANSAFVNIQQNGGNNAVASSIVRVPLDNVAVTHVQQSTTAPTPVKEGDYFQVRVRNNTGSNFNVIDDFGNSWFAVYALQAGGNPQDVVAISGTFSEHLTISGVPVSTGTSGGASLDPSQDQTITGNWDFQGNLTKDGVDVATVDDLSAASGTGYVVPVSGTIVRPLSNSYDPIGLWVFDGDLTDSSGNGNDLTAEVGSSNIVRIAPYLQGNAFAGDTILVAGDDSDLELTGDATIQAIVIYAADTIVSATKTIAGQTGPSGDGVDANNFLMRMSLNTTDSVAYFAEDTGGANISFTSAQKLNGRARTAHHLAIVRENDDVTVYIDGVRYDSSSGLSAPVDGSATRFRIGGDISSGAGDNFFTGVIASVKYNDFALSDAQIRREYESLLHDINVPGTPAVSGDVVVSRAIVRRDSTNQTINASTNTEVIWDTTNSTLDPDDWADVGGSNPTRLTVPEGLNIDKVNISCQIEWTANSTGRRGMLLKKNGALFNDGRQYLDFRQATSTNPLIQNVNWPNIEATSGDYFELTVNQESGGNLDIVQTPNSWMSVEGITSGGGTVFFDDFTASSVAVAESLTISGVPVSTGTGGGGSGDGNITDINSQEGPSITITGTGAAETITLGNAITVNVPEAYTSGARGALMSVSSGTSVPNDSTAFVAWDTAHYDTDSFWSSSEPTRLTIPAGIRKVRLSARFRWTQSTNGDRRLIMRKNGNGSLTQDPSDGQVVFEVEAHATEDSGVGTVQDAMSPIMEVVEGDYFEVLGRQGSGGALDLLHETMWWQLEVVDPVPVVGPGETVFIRNVELESDGDLVIDNIPQNATHLRIIASLRSDDNNVSDACTVQFNDDTGANYDVVWRGWYADNTDTGSGVDGAGVSNARGLQIPADNAAANQYGQGVYDIHFYSDTTRNKNLTARGSSVENTNDGDVKTDVIGLGWRNTDGITKISFSGFNGTGLKAGSKVTVYGLGNELATYADKVVAASGTFSESLTISGVPVSLGGGGSASTLQDAYDNGDGVVSTTFGKPFVVSGTEYDADADFKVVGSGVFTEALQVGSGTTFITGDEIETPRMFVGGSELLPGNNATTLSGIIGRKLGLEHSPVALYLFEGSGNDSSGNGFDMSAGTAFQQTYMENGLSAHRADGNQLERTGTANDAALTIQGDITVQALATINTLDGTTNPLRFIHFSASGETEASNAQYSLALQGDGRLFYNHEFSAGTDQSFTGDASYRITAGSTYLIAFVRENNVVQFYVNGLKFGPASSTLTAPTGGTTAFIKTGNGTTSSQFAIGCAKVVDRALTEEEMYAEYQRTWKPAPLATTTGSSLWHGLVPPSSPSQYDDEFDLPAGSSPGSQWTTFDPGSDISTLEIRDNPGRLYLNTLNNGEFCGLLSQITDDTPSFSVYTYIQPHFRSSRTATFDNFYGVAFIEDSSSPATTNIMLAGVRIEKSGSGYNQDTAGRVGVWEFDQYDDASPTLRLSDGSFTDMSTAGIFIQANWNAGLNRIGVSWSHDGVSWHETALVDIDTQSTMTSWNHVALIGRTDGESANSGSFRFFRYTETGFGYANPMPAGELGVGSGGSSSLDEGQVALVSQVFGS
jgi:hypothetical protein